MDRARVGTIGAFVRVVTVALIAGLLTSCATGTGTERTGSLVWHGCGAIECTTMSVPLDWTRPGGRHIRLSLSRRPADGFRLGVLLTNPGGPGVSGVQFVEQAGNTFDRSVLDRFDIVSWDPRGVGASAPAGCGTNLDYFYAVDRNGTDSATANANTAVVNRFVADCRRATRTLLPHLSTRATVRDMEAIRAAMGEPTIDYLGFSYGSYLGARYADRYPGHVRSMVLDGAIDPAASYEDATIVQAEGFEHALDAFFAWCRDDERCAFARKARPGPSFDNLMSSLANETDPGVVRGEHRTLHVGEASIGVANGLYAGRSGWEALGAALNDAARGNGSALLALADSYTGREPGGTYDNETAAFYAIGCLDGPAPPTVAAVQQLASRAARVAPHFGAATAWLGLPCTDWPVPPVSAPAAIHAPAAPPIVVIGNTDDPATPYSQARALARELRSGRLLTYVGEGHTAYGRNDCIDAAVDRYLITRVPPAAGTRCH